MRSTVMTIIITVLILLLVAALSVPTITNMIIHHHQQQEALATQGDTRMPNTNAASCGQVVEGLVELNSDLL